MEYEQDMKSTCDTKA